MTNVSLFNNLNSGQILSGEGPFSKILDDFTPREQQQSMADAISEAIDNYAILIAEAGTGTGKTFAYLVPAVLSGKKVIISTGTKTLQDQLFAKDIPIVKDALNTPFTAALLKGRANYICHYRFGQAESDGRFSSRKEVGHLKKISGWKKRTQSGDIAEVSSIPEDALIWSKMTSTGDSCLGKDCPSYERCFVAEARRKAQDAEIVVVNHHLLFADMSIKENGFGEILPNSSTYIIDEAHQVPEIASDFFGLTISSRQLNDLLRDSEIEYHNECGDVPGFTDLIDNVKKVVMDFRLSFGVDPKRSSWSEVENNEDVMQLFSKFSELLQTLEKELEVLATRGKGMENCYRRTGDIVAAIKKFSSHNDSGNVQWFETFSKSFMLRTTPLDISETFQEQIVKTKSSWIFTSATLAVDGEFDHYKKTMGIEEAETLLVTSPFAYSSNAVLYSPLDMPQPNHFEYTEKLVEEVLPLIKACGGRTFLLFTSYRALDNAADIISESVDYPVLVQGEMARGELLKQFRELGNAILLGTGSFWEGVDVKGSALSMVVIDKLPFSSPGDPVMQARINAINNQGGNAFIDYQLPRAVITLKQGVGRLIRDESDKGVMVIGDPRLLTKSYGKKFIKSLPLMAKTRRKERVVAFLDNLP